MNNTSLLSALCFLLIVLGTVSARSRGQDEGAAAGQGQGAWQLQKLTAQEPSFTIKAEGGESRIWNWNNEQLSSIGMGAALHIIKPRGLFLPSYTNTPLLMYIIRGNGMLGVVLPGCPETFQSSSSSSQEEKSSKFNDQHQKIRRFRQGDVVALSAGWAHWCYNDGNEDVEVIVVEDIGSNLNQLDKRPRKFFLAGNPGGFQGEQQKTYQKAQIPAGNIFAGLMSELLSQVYKSDQETTSKVRGEDDKRGHIVLVEDGLDVVNPPSFREEEERGNGLEESFCSVKLIQNINDPSRADIFNPKAGRFNTLTGNDFPIFNLIGLSAERGVLYRDAMVSPHYKLNAHTIKYCTRGEARIQIADQSGNTVFDEVLREGELLVIPQNYVVVIQAGEKGFEWVGFRTHQLAMHATLAGKTSVMRALPASVISASYRIPKVQAMRFKNNQKRIFLIESKSGSGRVAAA